MSTYELDTSESDTHLVASTEGKRVLGQFSLLVVIDAYSSAIVGYRIVPRWIRGDTPKAHYSKKRVKK